MKIENKDLDRGQTNSIAPKFKSEVYKDNLLGVKVNKFNKTLRL